MLISVSGSIGSGKDTVGSVIQYLIWKNEVEMANLSLFNYTLVDFQNSPRLGNNLIHFEIKKWADKLKDIICILLNCTREQLEDRDFKENELGEEWWIIETGYKNGLKPNVILYSKEILNQLGYGQHNLRKTTPRLLLQLLGTDCGRNIIHPNIWVNSLMSEYKMSYVQHKDIEYVEHKQYPNWIITDTRFPNELDAVKNRGGLTIKVVRGKPKCGCITRDIMQCDVDCDDSKVIEHASETALDGIDCKYTIYNNGTIEELIEKVKLTLIEEKLI